jgi:hypothetical protein
MVAGSKMARLTRLERMVVEPMGFEPTTSSMPSRRAPNCATAPPKKNYSVRLYSIRRREASNLAPIAVSRALGPGPKKEAGSAQDTI